MPNGHAILQQHAITHAKKKTRATNPTRMAAKASMAPRTLVTKQATGELQTLHCVVCRAEHSVLAFILLSEMPWNEHSAFTIKNFVSTTHRKYDHQK